MKWLVPLCLLASCARPVRAPEEEPRVIGWRLAHKSPRVDAGDARVAHETVLVLEPIYDRPVPNDDDPVLIELPQKELEPGKEATARVTMRRDGTYRVSVEPAGGRVEILSPASFVLRGGETETIRFISYASGQASIRVWTERLDESH